MTSIQDILPRLRKPKKFPGALPLIHVSKSGRPGFESIVSDLSLSPNHCDVFNTNLLYLSYGGAFYEPSKQQNKIKAPICFLFNPKVMSKIDCYYPYDTGAAKHNKYGTDHSCNLRDNFGNHKVKARSNGNIHIPRQFVYYLYGTNDNYHRGLIKNKIQRKIYDSFPELFQFLEDKNIEGIDCRQHTIECHAIKKIDFRSNLEWIAYPDRYHDIIAKLHEAMQPSPPKKSPYMYIANRPISQIIGEIQIKAQEHINSKYRDF